MDRVLQLLLINKKASGLAIHVMREGGIGVAREAVFILQLLPGICIGSVRNED